MTPLTALNPRRGLPWVQNAIFFSLTAMEMAWFAPLVMIFLPGSWRTPPILYLLGLWAVMAGMMVIAHFLEQRDIASPAFELIVAGLLLVLGLLAIRIFVYSDEPATSIAWLGRLLSPGDDLLKIAVILGTLAFLWWRAVTFLQREITFFVIGYDFRKGVLALLLTTAIFRYVSHQSALLFVYVFFFFGLLAVALGRAEEKARTTGDGRAPIQRVWLGIVGVSVATVMLLSWLFGQIWSLDGFRALWRALTPVVGWTAPYIEAGMLFFLRLLNPLLEWFVNLIKSAVGGKGGEDVINNLTKNMPGADKVMGGGEVVSTTPGWLEFFVRYVLPVTIALVVLLVLVLWLVKRRQSSKLTTIDEEHTRVESLEGQGLMDALRRGFGRVKDLAGLVGQFGVGKGFYAAVSIRHIYANLQKLAAERGYPRDPAWTPNDYLPALKRAFPGQDEALQHITEVYNAYEYGHVSTDPAEMEKLKAAWEAIRTMPETEISPSSDIAN